ncbi:MAG: hypothetical protein HXY34_05205 [Candidatus Thorarchaeota archaeon]|nr:hypothetical protein [Candidatus Thorarchaeota archaeon]
MNSLLIRPLYNGLMIPDSDIYLFFRRVAVVRPPCEIVQKELLPLVRSCVARALKDHGLSQNEIGARMRVTQAAVSKYLSGPLAEGPLYAEVEGLIEQVTEDLLEGRPESDVIDHLCRVCMELRIGSVVCRRHRETHRSLKEEDCQACAQLLGGERETFQSRFSLLSEMRVAMETIEGCSVFHRLIPEVRSNLVACDSKAKESRDVVGIPGRITVVRGRVRALASPEYGASGHTAKMLLWARSFYPRVHACLAISGKDETVRAAQDSGFPVERIASPAGAVEEIIEAARLTTNRRADYTSVHLPGGLGIEPILYLFGPSAVELAQRAVIVAERLSQS